MKMYGREGGVGKIVVALLVIIILVVGLVIIGSIMSGDGGEAPGEAGTGPPSGEEVGSGPLSLNLSAVISIYREGDRLYVYGVKHIMDENGTQVVRKDYYVITLSMTRGEILASEKILEVPGTEPDPLSGSLVSIYSNRYVIGGTARERALIPFPLPLPLPFITVEFGSVDLYYYIVEPGIGIVKEMLIEDVPGLGLGFYGDKYLTFFIDYEKMYGVLRAYGLETGGIVFEGYYDISGVFQDMRLDGTKKLAYMARDGDSLSVVVMMSSVVNNNRTDFYIMLIRVDLESLEFIVEAWPTLIVSRPAELAYTTAYIDGEDLYIFYSYDYLLGANETDSPLRNRRDYQVEKWSLASLTKEWSVEGSYTRTEDNTTVGSVTSVYYDGVYYVSEAFLAAYRDGEELWRRDGWGGRGGALVVFIPVTTYYGGHRFYIVDGELYILWLERSDSGSIVSDGLRLYRVSPEEGATPVYIQVSGALSPGLIINHGERLYAIVRLSDGGLVFEEVVIRGS